jgi:CPA1 family monovalent cation:H+ antiporter
MLEVTAVCLVITALLAYLNQRYIGLPTVIGMMAASLTLSLALVALDAAGISFGLRQYEETLVRSIDFSNALMQGMLSMLLFAGALHVDLKRLKIYSLPVAGLALLGTMLSTLAVGFGMWHTLPFLGLHLPLIHCLLFGALISPTDPIAVMGILKSAGAPKELELVIAGESLFNDGVGVVIFSLLVDMLASGITPTADQALQLLLREAGGGLLFGLALGYVTFTMLKSVDNYQVEVLLTLAAVTGGYMLASKIHVSGPLAMVVVGLMIGNQGRALAMSETTRRYLDMFWELLDQILNALLFVLMGMAVLLVTFRLGELAATALAVAVTLVARAAIVGLPAAVLPRAFNLPRGSWKVLTWGGLRGGISVALALSLPAGSERDTVVALTYGVVVFSIFAQGLSIGYVTRKSVAQSGTN